MWFVKKSKKRLQIHLNSPRFTVIWPASLPLATVCVEVKWVLTSNQTFKTELLFESIQVFES